MFGKRILFVSKIEVPNILVYWQYSAAGYGFVAPLKNTTRTASQHY